MPRARKPVWVMVEAPCKTGSDRRALEQLLAWLQQLCASNVHFLAPDYSTDLDPTQGRWRLLQRLRAKVDFVLVCWPTRHPLHLHLRLAINDARRHAVSTKGLDFVQLYRPKHDEWTRMAAQWWLRTVRQSTQ